MAMPTVCQTPDAVYETTISPREVCVRVALPFNLDLTEAEAALLEANLHNAVELVLASKF